MNIIVRALFDPHIRNAAASAAPAASAAVVAPAAAPAAALAAFSENLPESAPLTAPQEVEEASIPQASSGQETSVYASSMTFMFGKTNDADVCGLSLLVALKNGEVRRYGLQPKDNAQVSIIQNQNEWCAMFGNDGDEDDFFIESISSNYVFFEETADFYFVVCCLEHATGLKFLVSAANKKTPRINWKDISWQPVYTFTVNSVQPTLQSLTVFFDALSFCNICFSTVSNSLENSKSEIFVQSFDSRKRINTNRKLSSPLLKGNMDSKASPPELLSVISTTKCFTAIHSGIACSFPVYLPIMPESRVALSAAYMKLFFGPQKSNSVLPFAHASVNKQIASFYSENREQLQQLATVKELQSFFMNYGRNQEEPQSLNFYDEVLPAFVNGLKVVRLLCVEESDLESSQIVWKQFHDECFGLILIVTRSLSSSRFEVRNESGIVVGWFFRQHLQQVDSWNQPRDICAGLTVVCPVENSVTEIFSDVASTLGTVLQGSSDFTDGSFVIRRIDGSTFDGKWGVISRSQKFQTSVFNCRIINKSHASKFYQQGFRWCAGDDDSTIRCESEPQFHIAHNEFFCSSHRPGSSKELLSLSLFNQNRESGVTNEGIPVELQFKPDFFGEFSSIFSSPQPGDLLQYPWNEWRSDVEKLTFHLDQKPPFVKLVVSKSSSASEKLAKDVFISFFGDWRKSNESDKSQTDLIKMGLPYKIVDVIEDSKQGKLAINIQLDEVPPNQKADKPPPDTSELFIRLSCLASKNDFDDVVVKCGLKTAKYLESALVPFKPDIPQLCPGLVLQMKKPPIEKFETGPPYKFVQKMFTVVAPNVVKHDKFHPNKNFGFFGSFLVTFDSK